MRRLSWRLSGDVCAPPQPPGTSTGTHCVEKTDVPNQEMSITLLTAPSALFVGPLHTCVLRVCVSINVRTHMHSFEKRSDIGVKLPFWWAQVFYEIGTDAPFSPLCTTTLEARASFGSLIFFCFCENELFLGQTTEGLGRQLLESFYF